MPKSLLGIAVNHTLKQWNRLLVYLEHGDTTPDNNLAENAIRPVVVGRKNWLFSGTPEGAQASACLYSLIETAKAYNLEPYKYLRYLFTLYLIGNRTCQPLAHEPPAGGSGRGNRRHLCLIGGYAELSDSIWPRLRELW